MFHSFFPRPKLFLFTFIAWALLCVVLWFTVAINHGQTFSMGSLFGFDYPPELHKEVAAPSESEAPKSGDGAPDKPDSDQPEAKKPKPPTPEEIAHQEQTTSATNFWFYQYMLFAYAIFVGAWMLMSKHRWARWSVAGSAVILFTTWFQVQIDVLINTWFRTFYDLIQLALSKPGSVTMAQYWEQWWTFGKLAMISITVSVLTGFFVNHWVFRWRTAMNDYYTSVWKKVRHIEGASQRIQEDTMRFASIMKSLGVRFIAAIMTLIAFLPILWGLSKYVKEIPVFGEVAQALVVVAILWSVFGTALLALVGIRLPGLEFRNQRVEAAYRKELVYGEDDPARATPPTLYELFNHVRKNYFRLYFNYMYFDVVRYGYLQAGVMVPYIAMGPAIVLSGVMTLGIMQQILRAFGQVENSFQFLVNSWTTIVELMSIYKRLQAFEATINDEPLPKIDQDFLSQTG